MFCFACTLCCCFVVVVIRGVDVRTERKVRPLKVQQTRDSGDILPREHFSNFVAQKCHFLRLPQDILDF